MSRMPGFTAESTLYISADSYWFRAGVGTPSIVVRPAYGFVTVKSSWSSWFRVMTLLCCEECYGRGERCVPDDVGGCFCIPNLPPHGGGATSPD